MFDSKRKSLATAAKAKSGSENAFVNAAMKKGVEVKSGNGALKYSSTGNEFVNQFGKVSEYRAPRAYSEIATDLNLLWSVDKKLATKFAIYLRMISRPTQYLDGSATSVPQKGAEMRHEGIMRMLSLYFKDENVFWANIGLFISAGSWKDIFTMLSYDLVHHDWAGRKLDWKKFGDLILSGLENTNSADLIKKYLPQIKANSACKTVESQADNMIAKWVCSLLYGSKAGKEASTYKLYRKLKSSGTAHEWQKLISQRKFDRIEFDKIHGRALSKLVNSKFLFNQNLSDKYQTWITSPETKDVKYTGFVHELFEPLNLNNKFESASISKVAEETINKQFDTLVKKAGEAPRTNLIVVRDTSSSMTSKAEGTNMSSYNIGKALALYFSEFLVGPFSNSWIEFNNRATMHQWVGKTPVDRWRNDRSEAYGSTNFQSVIDLFCQLKGKGIREEDFPSGILCISDGEFNPASLGRTNVENAKFKLRQAGFSDSYVNDFVIVLWNIPNGYYRNKSTKFETYGDVPNVFYFSGYSASVISFLSGKIKTSKELFLEAMSQELLERVEI